MDEVINTKQVGLLQKLAKVFQEIQTVERKGENTFHHYKYAREEDLLGVVRPLFMKYGLLPTATDLERKKEEQLTSVKMQFTIYDIDTGASITSMSYGDGEDKGDKGVYKAKTGAMKYFLSKFFMIPTGDDPEKEEKEDKPSKPATRKIPDATPSDPEERKQYLDKLKKMVAGLKEPELKNTQRKRMEESGRYTVEEINLVFGV